MSNIKHTQSPIKLTEKKYLKISLISIDWGKLQKKIVSKNISLKKSQLIYTQSAHLHSWNFDRKNKKIETTNICFKEFSTEKKEKTFFFREKKDQAREREREREREKSIIFCVQYEIIWNKKKMRRDS